MLETLLLNQFGAFVLVLARVGAVVATAPLLSTKAAPMHVRVVLAVALSLMVAPLFGAAPPVSVLDSAAFGWHLASEALLGSLLGLGVTILLSGIQLTGQIISQLGGTAISESFDPSLDESVPIYSQLFYFLALVMFVLLDGHEMIIEALLETYKWLPPGRAGWGATYTDAAVTLLSQSFLLGIRAAAPAMTALLLATLVLGLIGRTMPQINVLAVGFSVNAFTTLACLVVSIGAIALTFPQRAVDAITVIRDAIAAGNGV
ncbi:MAG: flagellar biosynthetic protein FliR [Planctomycetales bacterium]|nr:flagellar biosynthetic protein FliR [Planctomycetales bacterium]